MVTGSTHAIVNLVERVGAAITGETVTVPIGDADPDLIAQWCARTGNQLVEVRDQTAMIRRGPLPDDATLLAEVPADRRPGARLWLYTNFDCNLACDYCCARSSPQAKRRALGPDRVRRLIEEAADSGVAEVFLTGGEPFMLTDLDEIVAACVARLPTTLLTNGMLFRGSRLAMLRRMPRNGLALQISLDSATPELHDLHRGAGTWQRALAGIRTALGEGFRVRVAATVAADDSGPAEQKAFHLLLDELGVARDDQIVRPIAQRGFADDGVALTVESLVPEVTVTAEGVYWHPVAADHADQLVTTELFPLGDAIAEVKRRFVEHRRTANATAQQFPCA